jgi:hypothetical protein
VQYDREQQSASPAALGALAPLRKPLPIKLSCTGYCTGNESDFGGSRRTTVDEKH